MFNDFANVWTIVAEARALKPGQPLGMTVAGERVVASGRHRSIDVAAELVAAIRAVWSDVGSAP